MTHSPQTRSRGNPSEPKSADGKAGPEGATVFLALHAVDGKVFETLDQDMNVLDASTVAETASNLGFANPGAAA